MSSPRAGSTKNGFSALGLSVALVDALTILGYEEPTPVQRETIPRLLAGRDLVALAATGTGKTAAFALPMIQRLAGAVGEADTDAKAPRQDEVRLREDVSRRAAGIHEERPRLAGRKKPPSPATTVGRTAGMVLVPTRELAMQVCEAIHKYARGTSLTVVPLYGGASMDQQIRALTRGADVVVATPGRALDHIRRKTLLLDAIRVLVLDEADEMLDMGFAEDLEAILERRPPRADGAVLRHACPPASCRSPSAICERRARDDRREKTAAGKVPRASGGLHRPPRPQAGGARSHPRHGEPDLRDRLLPHAARGGHAGRNAERARLPAEALHGGMQQRQRDRGDERVPRQKTDLLDRHRRRCARARHRARLARRELRPARAPESYVHRIGRTDAPAATGPPSRWPSPGAPAAAQHRALHEAEDRRPRCRP
jgi:ATP-dependent RNA helicase DeaD